MGQEVADLIHEVDAQLLVLYGDVDVHAADRQPAADTAEVAGERLVAFLGRRLEALFLGKGMGRGGDGSEIVLSGIPGNGPAADGRVRRERL